MRKLETKNGNEIWQYDSATEVVKFSDDRCFQHQSSSFVGERLNDWEAIQARVDRDWAEGMYTLKQFSDKLRNMELPEIKSKKRKTQFSETDGDEVDFDRLREGQAFFRKSVRESTAGPSTVTIVIDTTTEAAKKSEDILWRGAAAIALTEILEEKGYSVELWVVNGSKLYRGEHTRVMTACCLKLPSDPLDTSTLINTVAGWFYRTVTFTLVRTICKLQNKTVEFGLGHCYTPTQDDLDHLTTDENRVYISSVYSYNSTATLIEAEVAKLAETEATTD